MSVVVKISYPDFHVNTFFKKLYTGRKISYIEKVMTSDSFGTIAKSIFHSLGENSLRLDRAHSLAVVFLLSVVFLSFVLIYSGVTGKRIRKIPATLAVLFSAGIIYICILASSVGTLVFLPSDTPKHAAELFMNACVSSDERTTSYMYLSDDVLFPAADENDEVGMIYQNALKDSYSYEMVGECELSGTTATQQIRLNSLDLNRPVPDIFDTLHEDLAVLIENSKKSDIYDSEENYRPEVLEKVYKDAAEKVLADPSKYYSSTELTLTLNYIDGEWKVVPDNRLKLALAGFVPSGISASNNIKSEVLGELTYIPKVYTIAENAVAGPKPNTEKYGTTEDPNDILALFDEYPRLIGDKEPFFSPESEFVKKEIQYYADDTILVVTWKEKCLGHFCTFSEVYVADPSQFRRKLSADTFGSSIQKFASELSKETNAVVAMNGDFYRFRGEGMTVYQKKLYRFNPYKLEVCHIDGSGNLKFTYSGELKNAEAAEQYIKDNDINFSVCFGPVLVDNYEPHISDSNYLLGQVNERYSRSALSQRGSCHYLLTALNHGYGCPTATLDELRNIMMSKNVENSYTLDGGQTGEIIMQHKVLNQIDFDTERTVSDILYFVTAIPEDEND